MPEIRDLPAFGSDPDEWEGDIHTLTVHSVRLPEDQLDDGDLDYDLEHAPSCKEEDYGDVGEFRVMAWDCDVVHVEGDIGLAYAFRYSGTPVTEPGTYRIRAWGRRTYHHEYGYEYDGSVAVITEDEDRA